jgi:hypothetical protein
MQVPASSVHRTQLDYANGSVANYSATGDLVLLPDWLRIQTLAQGTFSDGGLQTGSRIEVLNGAGVSGQAEALAAWLRQAGARIKGFASARSYNYARTEVAVAPQAPGRVQATARSVATLLQVSIVSSVPAEANAPIVVIIGRDFADPTQQ